MTANQLAALMKRRLEARGESIYAFQMRLAGKVSHMTCYRAFRGQPIKTDTMLILLDALELEIRPKETR